MDYEVKPLSSFQFFTGFPEDLDGVAAEDDAFDDDDNPDDYEDFDELIFFNPKSEVSDDVKELIQKINENGSGVNGTKSISFLSLFHLNNPWF